MNGGDLCHRCGKRVYAAELRRYDGMIFHCRCMSLWSKEQAEKDAAARNAEYMKKPDVSPAYYRVGDPTTGQQARMLSGEEERAEMAAEKEKQKAAEQKPAEKTGCPACGYKDAHGKFCSECGAKL